VIQYFYQGGWAMYPILACAVIGVMYILERFYTMMIKARLSPRRFLGELRTTLREQGVGGAIALCDQKPSPVAKVLKAGLERQGRGKELIEEALSNAASTELAFLDRGMLVLAAIANVAPLIGFLGTVVGMIVAFNAIKALGEVDPVAVADGISIALITTASGLMVAIPVALFHVFFTNAINRYTRDMEEAANALVETMMEMDAAECVVPEGKGQGR
jgi:biopolymer transport protein ExbB